MQLTPAQQDYLEAIYRLEQTQPAGARITDIAEALGTRLPTVVRNVGRLREAGLVCQEQRGPVSLTTAGEKLGSQLVHRHDDTVKFLTEILGVSHSQAESEACILEHALSGHTSQRLHLFLKHWKQLDPELRSQLALPSRRISPSEFTLLGPGAGSGGRK